MYVEFYSLALLDDLFTASLLICWFVFVVELEGGTKDQLCSIGTCAEHLGYVHPSVRVCFLSSYSLFLMMLLICYLDIILP